MPHIVIEGPVQVAEFYRQFAPFEAREQGVIMKVNDALLNAAGQKMLLECVVVEDRTPMMFYMALTEHHGNITVHLDPLTDPEKTAWVKKLIALVAHKLKSLHPDCRYGKTNLDNYLL